MRLKAFLFLLIPSAALAWGPEGHRIVGVEALAMLDGTARDAVREILNGDSDQVVDQACSWPDHVRKTAAWEWSEPQHYVNIPRGARQYLRDRDCPDGMCVTEAIVKYANELSRTDLDAERRWQAFAWLCHLVGDLHQPLHAGYRDDRGGNSVDIEYRDEDYNLHQYWDGVVIRERLGSGDRWTRPYPGQEWSQPPRTWEPEEVAAWTGESHERVAAYAYPPGRVIDTAFADRSWLIIRQQWQEASRRLAQILNAVLGESDVVIGEEVTAVTNPGRF
jgi:hypothetical protein